MSDNSRNNDKAGLWEWVKAICLLTTVGVVSFKVYEADIKMTVDFPTLLSLLLALFSVALAALFYFKATETSNTFYDNTYNFTKDIAQLLAKIESGFGEKLRNLDEGYSSVRDYIQNTGANQSIDETKEKIQGEKQEIEKVIEERNQIVRDLFEQAQLQEEEKEKIQSLLEEKENELRSSQRELTRMEKRLFMEKVKKREAREVSTGMEEFTVEFIIKKIDPHVVLNSSANALRRKIDEQLDRAPRQYIEDLENHGFFDNGINSNGIRFIRNLANDLV